MGKRPIATSAVALAIVLVIAGCGGSDDDNTAATKAEFVETSADACAEGQEPLQAEYTAFVEENGLDGTKEPTKAQQADLNEFINSAVQVEVDVISENDPPSGDQDEVDAILNGLEKALRESEEDPSRPATATTAFDRTRDLAQAYGFDACGLR